MHISPSLERSTIGLAAYLPNLARQLVYSSDPGKTTSESILRPLLDRVHTQLLARPVPVRDWKRHRGLSHKIHRVPQIRGQTRRCLAALFHPNTSNSKPAHRFFQQIRLQHRARETVPSSLHHHGLIRARSNEIHQLEESDRKSTRLNSSHRTI